MPWTNLQRLTPEYLSLVIILGVGLLAWRRRAVAGAAWLTGVAALEAIWIGGAIGKALSPDLDGKLFWDSIGWLGTGLAVPLLASAVQYSGRRLRYPWRVYSGLFLPYLTVTALAFSDSSHHLIRLDPHLVPSGATAAALVYGFSPLVWALAVYSYGLYLMAAALLLAMWAHALRPHRAQIITVLVGAAIPATGVALTLFGLLPETQRDISAYTFALSNVILAFGLFYLRLLDQVPIARDTAINAMQEALFVIDAGGRILDVNEAACQAAGRSEKELVGRPAVEALPGWLGAAGAAGLRTVTAPGGGTWEVSEKGMASPSGQALGRLLIARDITSRTRAEEDLRESEARFHGLFQNHAAAMLLIDPGTGRIADANRAAADFYGYTIERLRGMNIADLNTLPPERVAEKRQQAAAQNLSYFIFPHRLASGEVRTVEVHSTPVNVGRTVLFSIIHDVTDRVRLETDLRESHDQLELRVRQRTEDLERVVTRLAGEVAERRQAEQALSESESKFRGIVTQSSDGILLSDEDGRVIECNEAMQTVTGRSPESTAGQYVWEFLSDLLGCPEQRAGAEAAIRAALAGGPAPLLSRPIEAAVRTPDGERTVQIKMFPVRAERGWRLAAITRDITERRRAEEEIRRMNQDLEQRVAERTAALEQANADLQRASRAKDEFLASMSHELRTPLNAMLTLAESIGSGTYGPLTDRQVKSLGGITNSGQHLLTLINDILSLSKYEAGKLELAREPVDVGQICRASLQLVEPQARRKGINMAFSHDFDVRAIEADERYLKQMLVNLLDNAVKFTASGQKVGLDVTGDRAAGEVTFTVWDQGIGIAPEDAARLFQPFTQVDSRLARQYGGTGLGLALVSRLASLHGGRVSMTSTPGEGSRFTLNMPWAEAAPAPANAGAAEPQAADEAEPKPESLPGDAPMVLLAEDNDDTRAAVAEFLESKGYRMLTAADGPEALAQARAERPALILMDIQMPGLNGFDAIRALRADPAFGSVAILALTALAMPGDRERCLAAGADDYLVKPVRLRELAERVAANLTRIRALSAA